MINELQIAASVSGICGLAAVLAVLFARISLRQANGAKASIEKMLVEPTPLTEIGDLIQPFNGQIQLEALGIILKHEAEKRKTMLRTVKRDIDLNVVNVANKSYGLRGMTITGVVLLLLAALAFAASLGKWPGAESAVSSGGTNAKPPIRSPLLPDSRTDDEDPRSEHESMPHAKPVNDEGTGHTDKPNSVDREQNPSPDVALAESQQKLWATNYSDISKLYDSVLHALVLSLYPGENVFVSRSEVLETLEALELAGDEELQKLASTVSEDFAFKREIWASTFEPGWPSAMKVRAADSPERLYGDPKKLYVNGEVLDQIGILKKKIRKRARAAGVDVGAIDDAGFPPAEQQTSTHAVSEISSSCTLLVAQETPA